MSEENLTFVRRAISITPEYRPLYRMALIVMILNFNCRGNSSSLLKLHLFSWALKSKRNMDSLTSFVLSDYSDQIDVFNIEPSLNRALNYCIGERLMDQNVDKYTLTNKGIDLLKLILGDSTLFINEKLFLNRIGKGITETKITELKNKWNRYAKN